MEKREVREEQGKRGQREVRVARPDSMPRLATKRGREKFERSRVGATRRDEKA